MGMIETEETIKATCEHHITLRHIRTGERREYRFRNMVLSLGKNMLARRLAGEGNDCELTHGAVGTGTTTPAPGDTSLETEIYRKQLSQRSAVGNQVRITLFFGPTEANGQLREYAFFGEDADMVADSGTIFNRAAINVNKTSSYTMTIDSTLTLT